MTPASRRLTAGGFQMHGVVAGAGTGPAVVLVHGLGASSRYMLPLARCLAGRAEVHAIDLPGFGRSPPSTRPIDLRMLAEAVAAWIEATGLDRPLLVGNSVGCHHVVEVAARGSVTCGLVLVGPTVDDSARTWPRQLGRFLADVPREATLPLIRAVLPAYLRAEPRRILRLFRHALRDPVETRIRGVEAPVVVVRGERDPVAPFPWCHRLATSAPAGRVVTIPGAAHAAHFSHPAAVAEAAMTLVR